MVLNIAIQKITYEIQPILGSISMWTGNINNPINSGIQSIGSEKNIIIEALKFKDINNIENNNLISPNENDKIIQFRQFY